MWRGDLPLLPAQAGGHVCTTSLRLLPCYMISWLVNSTSETYLGESIIFGADFLPCYNTTLLDWLHRYTSHVWLRRPPCTFSVVTPAPERPTTWTSGEDDFWRGPQKESTLNRCKLNTTPNLAEYISGIFSSILKKNTGQKITSSIKSNIYGGEQMQASSIPESSGIVWHKRDAKRQKYFTIHQNPKLRSRSGKEL